LLAWIRWSNLRIWRANWVNAVAIVHAKCFPQIASCLDTKRCIAVQLPVAHDASCGEVGSLRCPGNYGESARVYPCKTRHLVELEGRIKSLGLMDAKFDTNRHADDFKEW